MAEPDYSDLLTVDTPDDEVVQPEPEAVAAAPAEPAEPAEPAHRNSANERIQDLIRQRDEERAERQQRQAEAQQLRDEVAALRHRIETPVTPEPEVPSFMEDPEGHLNVKISALHKEIEALDAKAAAGSQAAAQAAEATRQQLMQRQFVDTVNNAEKDFHAAHPDYYAALEHIRTIQRAEMSAAGLSAEAIESAITQAELQTAITSMSNGKNPAEFAYKRAEIYGYKPTTATTPAARIDEQAEMAERRAAAGTIGGSGTGDAAGMDDDEARSWAPFERAFKEMFGKDLH